MLAALAPMGGEVLIATLGSESEEEEEEVVEQDPATGQVLVKKRRRLRISPQDECGGADGTSSLLRELDDQTVLLRQMAAGRAEAGAIAETSFTCYALWLFGGLLFGAHWWYLACVLRPPRPSSPLRIGGTATLPPSPLSPRFPSLWPSKLCHAQTADCIPSPPAPSQSRTPARAAQIRGVQALD